VNAQSALHGRRDGDLKDASWKRFDSESECLILYRVLGNRTCDAKAFKGIFQTPWCRRVEHRPFFIHIRRPARHWCRETPFWCSHPSNTAHPSYRTGTGLRGGLSSTLGSISLLVLALEGWGELA